MKKRFIITAVLFTALACAIAFAASNGKLEGILPEAQTGESLEEVKGQFSTDFAEQNIPESSTAEESSQTDETTLPIEQTEPETTIPETTELITQPPVTEPPVTEPDVTTEQQLPVPSPQHFDSSLFIGDSRTVGLDSYADLGEATVFATKGMNVYRVFKEQIEVEGYGKMKLDEVLAAKKYDKIYLMLGLNEIGYNAKAVISKYSYLLDKIREAQPDAVIYLQANLHITTSRSSADEVYNNTKLNYLNSEMAALANGVNIFYIDANPIFDDAAGGLCTEYAADDFHLKSDYYAMWVDWIANNSI